MKRGSRLLYIFMTLLFSIFFTACSQELSAFEKPPAYVDIFSESVAPASVTFRTVSRVDLEKEVFNIINSERKSQGLPLLMWDETLYETSTFKSRSMIEHDYFGHDNPYLGADKNSTELVRNHLGVDYYYGENIAYSNSTFIAESIYELFYNSDSHRELMFDKNPNAIGISIIEVVGAEFKNLPDGHFFVITQHFGDK